MHLTLPITSILPISRTRIFVVDTFRFHCDNLGLAGQNSSGHNHRLETEVVSEGVLGNEEQRSCQLEAANDSGPQPVVQW